MKNTITTILFFATATLGILKAGDKDQNTDTYQITTHIIQENIIANENQEVRLNGMYLEMSKYIFDLYSMNEYKPIWTDPKNAESTCEVINLLKQSHFFGVNTEYFPIDFIEHILNDINKSDNPEKVAMRKTQLEFILSNSVFQFIALLKFGEAQYTNYEFFDQDLVDLTDLPSKLWYALQNKTVIETIIVNEPRTHTYQTGIREIDFLIILIKKFQTKHSKKEPITKASLMAYTNEFFPGDSYLNTYLKDRLTVAIEENFEAWNSKYELNKMKPHYLASIVYDSAQDLSKKHYNSTLAQNIAEN